MENIISIYGIEIIPIHFLHSLPYTRLEFTHTCQNHTKAQKLFTPSSSSLGRAVGRLYLSYFTFIWNYSSENGILNLIKLHFSVLMMLKEQTSNGVDTKNNGRKWSQIDQSKKETKSELLKLFYNVYTYFIKVSIASVVRFSNLLKCFKTRMKLAKNKWAIYISHLWLVVLSKN